MLDVHLVHLSPPCPSDEKTWEHRLPVTSNDFLRQGKCVTSAILTLLSFHFMPRRPFDRQEHVYRNDAFAELVKDGVRFFNGTPVLEMSPPERFTGTGVYAIYYTGKSKLYAKYGELNRLSYGYPIYVGKAVPKGWRQARTSHVETDQSTELTAPRSRQHYHVRTPALHDDD